LTDSASCGGPAPGTSQIAGFFEFRSRAEKKDKVIYLFIISFFQKASIILQAATSRSCSEAPLYSRIKILR